MGKDERTTKESARDSKDSSGKGTGGRTMANDGTDAFRDSYNYVCVMGYNLKPPVNKKEWDNAVLQGMRNSTKIFD